MKENLQKALHRMQSNNMIDLAQYYFNNQNRHVSNQEAADYLGVESRKVSNMRGSLRVNHGFQFDVQKKGSMLIGVTNVPCPRYKSQCKKINMRRSTIAPVSEKRETSTTSSSFNLAFSMMGV